MIDEYEDLNCFKLFQFRGHEKERVETEDPHHIKNHNDYLGMNSEN